MQQVSGTHKGPNYLFLLFGLSGFAGLIYESVWTNYLKLFLGHAAYAQTLVLAIFMGGLALGSWVCSRYSMSWRNLLLGYAVTEVVIGLCAMIFHNVFEFATQYSYASVIPHLNTSVNIVFFKWTISALLVLPQSVLLGMTFPLMTAGTIRMFPEHPGRSISMLYFTNSLGAAVGVLTSGFLLIKLAGLPGTIRIAGLINLGVGTCVWLLVRGLPVDAFTAWPDPDIIKDRYDRIWYWFLLAAAGVTGVASFIYEVSWIRMLSLVLGSSTHAFELMLSTFISGLAFGGLWIRYRIGRIADKTRFLFLVQIIMGALALFSLPLYGNTFYVMRWLMKVLPQTGFGYFLFNLTSCSVALMIMFPAAFCAGMTLPLITGSLIQRGNGEKSIGAVYAANTVGAIIGVFFSVHFGMPLLGLKGLMIVGAGIDMALGLALLWTVRPVFNSFALPAGITAACVFAVISAGHFVELDAYRMASGVYRSGVLKTSEDSELVFQKDGKTATVSLLLSESGLSIRTNGKPDAEIQMDPSGPAAGDEYTMVLLAVLPMAFNPYARTVANIGFGSGLTTATYLRNDAIEEIDTVEIEPVMAEAAKYFGPLVEAAYSDQRSRLYIDDAKTFFSARGQKYDIIVSEPSNPWVNGVSGLFSREFYGMISSHLTENGLFCQWLQLYEIDTDLVVSVLKALSENFDDFVVFAANNDDILIVAGNGKSVVSPDFDLLGKASIADALKRIQVKGPQDLLIRRIGDKKLYSGLLESSGIKTNSDYYPVLDQSADRTRFLHVNATELIRLAYTPLPLMELLGRSELALEETNVTPSLAFTRSLDIYTSMALRDYYLTGSFSPKYGKGPTDLEDRAARLKTLFSTECGGGSVERTELLYNVMALRMVPFLQPGELGRVWNKLESEACVRSFTSGERQWIALLKAIAQRDGKSMADAASALLETEQGLTGGQMEYLVAAGMAGYLMQGDGEHSLALWRDYRSRIYGSGPSPLFFRLLAAFAGKRQLP